MQKQSHEIDSDMQQQILDLQDKYHFQLSQNNCLKQQNKQLRHELKLIQSLDVSISSTYIKSFNILMQLIQSPVPLSSKLNPDDWQQLFQCMDILYKDKVKNKPKSFNCLSDEEISLWYFFQIRIKNTNLAIFFGISVQSLCKRKQRLKDKLNHI